MKSIIYIIFILLLFVKIDVFAQFHNYTFKYGIQGYLLQPSTEFDNDAYRLSLQGRGFLRTEIYSFLEGELGFGIGELNGKDFNNENWATLIFPSDLRLVFSPLASRSSSPYLYTGLQILRWKIKDFPSVASPDETKSIGWDFSIPLGVGIEVKVSNEILLDISGGYTFAMTDDLNYFNKPDVNDGYFNLGFGLTFVMGSGKKDEDNDGLSKAFEIEIGTDPYRNDSDNDLLPDGKEIKIYKTNPLSKDSDSDGINDYDEITKYKTDPNSTDTDGDNLNDYIEIETYKSSPLLKDTDKDKLTDGYEVNIYKTDPIKADTDGDRLNDYDELNKYNTDPTDLDTDDDNLTDGEEIIKYNTDPLVKDSDKIKKITNRKISHFNHNAPLIIEGITFEVDKADILPELEVILTNTLIQLKNNPTLSIEIRGHTDNVGNADYNRKLSLERAEAVRIWLVKKGIDALRIKAVGLGESDPISNNNTEEGRAKNRRIEIIKIQK